MGNVMGAIFENTGSDLVRNTLHTLHYLALSATVSDNKFVIRTDGYSALK